MPIVIQCTNCQRKLRVQDHLLGKTIKCPQCQTKFLAQVAGNNAAPQLPSASGSSGADATQPSLANDAPVQSLAEAMLRTPVIPPVSSAPASVDLVVQALEVTEPASAPSAPPPAGPTSGQRITGKPTATAAPLAIPVVVEPSRATPAPPQPFETSALHVLAVLGVILLLTSLLGCGLGWWIGAAVERAASVAQKEP
jgi:DNA-directed RNA polymerase subunit RPC12/RpoP